MNEEIKITNSYLSFKIGETSFCVSVNKVLNILELMKITNIPQSPEYMLGVINLRGEVLPVIDSRIKFGMQKSEDTINTCIIVLDIEFESEMSHIGFLVDTVLEVFEIEDQALLPAPGIDNEFIMNLDIDKVFTSDELIMVNSANKSEDISEIN